MGVVQIKAGEYIGRFWELKKRVEMVNQNLDIRPDSSKTNNIIGSSYALHDFRQLLHFMQFLCDVPKLLVSLPYELRTSEVERDT